MKKEPHPLLLPRRKVINDFPFNQLASPHDCTKKIFEVGSILPLFKADNGDVREYWYHHPITRQNYQDTWFDSFPNIFRNLKWWEERLLDELMSVKFVRITIYTGYWIVGDVVKVTDYKIDTKAAKFERYILDDTQSSIPLRCEPATEEEYIEFKNTKKR